VRRRLDMLARQVDRTAQETLVLRSLPERLTALSVELEGLRSLIDDAAHSLDQPRGGDQQLPETPTAPDAPPGHGSGPRSKRDSPAHRPAAKSQDRPERKRGGRDGVAQDLRPNRAAKARESQPDYLPDRSMDVTNADAFAAAVDETIKYFNDGDIVEGTVVKVGRDEVLLDIGYKTEGVIPSRELSIKHDVDPNEVVKLGDVVEALVLQNEDKEGRLILSKKRAQYERSWGTIEKVKEEDGVVTGTVIEVVKGGLILDIGVRAFMPASQVEVRHVRELQPYVGKELEAKIIELDRSRNNVVLSRRARLESQPKEPHGR